MSQPDAWLRCMIGAEVHCRFFAQVKKGNEGAGAAPKAHPGVTAAGAGGGVPSATGWQKLPAKGKKKKDKGRKMEAGLLGFETGVKYDLLERGDV